MRKLVGMGLCLLFVSMGCESSPADKARENLEGELGVRWSEETFIEAAMNGDTETVRLFLTAGMAPDTTGDEGKTALIWAAINGHPDTVQVLLNNVVDVNAIDTAGKTALIWAAEQRQELVVPILLANEATVAAKALDGTTALAAARKNGDNALAGLLQQAGAVE